VHHQPVLIEFQIFDIQTDQLRTPERPGKTHEHQRPVPNVESATGIEAGGDGAQVLTLTGLLPVWAVPRVRRIPFINRRTTGAWAGGSNPAAWWAWEIAEMRRVRVEALCYSASVVK